MNDFENHRRLLGILHLVWAGFAVVGAGAGTILIASVGLLPGLIDEIWIPLAITSTIAVLIAAMIMLFFFPSLIGGYGILRGRSWARHWLMVAAVLNLVAFPLGTALGIYTLWVTWPRPETGAPITGTTS